MGYGTGAVWEVCDRSFSWSAAMMNYDMCNCIQQQTGSYMTCSLGRHVYKTFNIPCNLPLPYFELFFANLKNEIGVCLSIKMII